MSILDIELYFLYAAEGCILFLHLFCYAFYWDKRHQWEIIANSCYFVDVIAGSGGGSVCLCVCFLFYFAGVRLFISSVFVGVLNFLRFEFSY